jgi:hypothetical protein
MKALIRCKKDIPWDYLNKVSQLSFISHASVNIFSMYVCMYVWAGPSALAPWPTVVYCASPSIHPLRNPALRMKNIFSNTVWVCMIMETFYHACNVTSEMKSFVFWDIMLCSPLNVIRHFRQIYRLHLQGWRINQVRNQCVAGAHLFSWWFLAWLIFDCEDGGDIFLQYVSWLSWEYIELYPRRQNVSYPLLWAPQILHKVTDASKIIQQICEPQ